MSKNISQRQSRNARAHAHPALRDSLPLRKTWPISLCVGLALGSIVFSHDALAGGPTGGVVVGGTGSITQSGNSTVINQASQKLALNWQTFNVGANESVLFNQPSRSAVALNRILDQNPSQIFGRINSNGQIFLINTHGIIFGATAQMNVGGLLASTLDLTPNDFLAGHYNLNATGAGAGIVNHGLIQAASGGSVALVGGSVFNDGLIFANYGKINLDGADHAVLDFDGNGLINIQITGELKDRLDAREAAVTNKGTLRAEDGTVVLQASATKDLFTNLVNNAGIVDASSISTDGGVVRLVGHGGGTVNSGSIKVSGVHGGSVQLLSDQDVNVSGSVDASGVLGGGNIRIGGGLGGGEGLLTAANSTLVAGAAISADATQSGNGGTIAVWGDQTSTIDGNLSARGGAQGGNGGFIETSAAHVGIADSTRVNTLAPHGQAGTWLIDPQDYTIASTGGDISGSTLSTNLAGGNVTILSSDGVASGSGNINVDDSVTWAANTLTLTAANNVNINNALNGSGTAALVLNSATANGDAAVPGGTININNSISTGGSQTYNGAVTLGIDTTLASSGSGNISFGSTVNGAYALTANTSGVTSFGGVVGGTAQLTSLTTDAGGDTTLGGNVTTSGAQTYGDTVTLGANANLTGSAVNLAAVTGAGNNLVVTGDAVLAGVVSGVNILQVTGATSLNTASVSTGGSQTYGGPVTLGIDTTLASSANISFDSTVDGAYALTANTSGVTRFDGVVGGAAQLTSLTTDAGGSTVLGGNVTTSGAQTYGDAVTLGANANLTGSAVNLAAVTGVGNNLTVTGNAVLAGVVSGINILQVTGTTSLNTASVSTGGSQTYGGPVTLGIDTTLASSGSGNISFGSTVNGAYALTANTSGVTSFDGAVGGVAQLTNLTTDAGGSTTLGGNVTTSGAQTYNDAVMLAGATILTSASGGNISFGSTVNGTQSLAINTGGATTFAGAVGGTSALTSLSTGAGGSTTLGGSVTTTGAQTYNDAVGLAGDATLTSTGGGDIVFANTLNGAHDLVVDTSGLSSFGGAVGGTNALTSLTTRRGSFAANALDIGAGGLSVTTTTGGIVQGGAFVVTGASSFDAGTNAITLTNANNDFTGAVSLTGGATQITDQNALTLGTLSTSGALTASSTGALSLGSGSVGGNLTATSNNGAISQAGALGVTGTSAINAGNGAIALSNANNDFQGAVTVTGAGVSLVDANDLSVSSLTDNANGNVSLIAGGALTLPAGALSAGTGNLTLAANGGVLSTGGALGGTNVSLTGRDGVTLGGDVSAVGTLALTSTNAAITQLAGNITTGLATVSAGSGAITLTGVGNDFTGAVSLTGGATQITDANALALGTLNTGALAAVSNGTLNLGGGDVGGNLVATSNNGAVNQTSALHVTGSSTINAGSGAISLANASNDFTGAVNLGNSGANNVSIRDANGLILGDISVGTGTLGVQAVGVTQAAGTAIVQSAAAGAASFNSGGGVLTLANTGNDFTGAVNLTGGTTQITDTNALVLGTLSTGNLTATSTGALNLGNGTVAGNLAATSNNGVIGQTGALAVTGSSTIDAGASTIMLTNAGNDFTGAVSLSNSGANDVAVSNANALVLGVSTIGSGALDLTATGISQTGAIVQAAGGGAVTLNAGAGDLTLTDTGNDFTGQVTASGQAVRITDATALDLVGLTSAPNKDVALVAGGQLTLAPAITVIDTGGGNLTLSSGASLTTQGNLSGNNVSLTGTNGLTLNGDISATGTLALTSSAGGISQVSGNILAGGASNIVGGTGAITLTSVGNDFQGAVSASGSSISLSDANGLSVALTTTGNSILSAGDSLAVSGTTRDLTTNAGATSFGATTVSGNLTTAASGAIGQTGALAVTGTSGFSAGANAITLANAGNNFGGAASLSNSGANNVSIRDANGLLLGNVNVGTGTLGVQAVGITQAAGTAITQSAAAGAASFNGGSGAVTLANTGNDFTGPVNLSGGATQITDSNALVLGTLSTGSLAATSTGALNLGSGTVTGNLVATSNNGAIGQTGALNVVGTSALNAGTGVITLASVGNDFQGAVSASGSSISLSDASALSVALTTTGNSILNAGGSLAVSGTTRDLTTSAGGTSFGATTVSGNLTTVASGAIGQTGALAVTGTSSFSAGANAITLANAGNNFGGAASLSNSGANNVSIRDANGLLLGNVNAGTGTLGVQAVGITQAAGTAITQSASAGAASFNGGSGAVTLANTGNDFTGPVNLGGGAALITDQNALTLGTLNTGALTATSSGALNLGSGNVGGNLVATSNNGAIGQTGALNVVGTSTLNAGTGAITLTHTNNDFIGAVTAAGRGVSITDANDLAIAGLTSGPNGAVSLIAGGSLALSGSAIDTGTADLTLASRGGLLTTSAALSGANVSLEGRDGVALNNNVSTPGGLNIVSGAAIIQGAGVVTAGTLSGSSVGDTTLGQANLIDALGSFDAANFRLTNAQALTVGGPLTTASGTGVIHLITTSGELAVDTALAGGDITLDSAGNLILTRNITGTAVQLISGGDISQSSGVITTGTLGGSSAGSTSLTQANKIGALGTFGTGNGFSFGNAQALALNGAISGGTGGVRINTAAGALTVGAGVSGSSVDLGGHGGLAINAAVNSGTGTTTLNSAAGAITEGAAGRVTAGVLTGQSAGNATLDGANQIDALGNFSAANFSLTNAQALAVIGPVNGGASTNLTTTAGNLAINGAVSGTTTTLKSAGAISEGTSGSITATTLSGQSAGATSLNGANHIGTLGSFTAANLGLTNAQALTVNGPVNGGASTALTTTAGNLTINGVVTGTTTTLKSAGAITEGTSGSITAVTLSGQSTGATSLTGANRVGTLGSFTAANFGLTNAQALTVNGPVNGGASTALTTTSGDLAINGAIAGTTVTLKSAGAISEGTSGSITAATLNGQSAGATSLDGVNHIGMLGGFSAANFSLTNAQALVVGGPVNGGAITALTTTAGDLAINGAVSGTMTTLKSAGAITEGAGGVITAGTLSGQAAGMTTLGSSTQRINNMVGTLGNFSSPSGFSMTNNRTVTLASVAGSAFTVNAGTSAFYLSVINGDLFQLGTTPVYNGLGTWGSTGRMGTASAPIYVVGTGLQTIANVGLPPAYFYAIDSSGNLLPLGGGFAINVPTAAGAGSAQNGNHGDSYIDPSVISANYRSYGIVPSGVRLPEDQQSGCDPDQPDQLDCADGESVGMVGILMNVHR